MQETRKGHLVRDASQSERRLQPRPGPNWRPADAASCRTFARVLSRRSLLLGAAASIAGCSVSDDEQAGDLGPNAAAPPVRPTVEPPAPVATAAPSPSPTADPAPVPTVNPDAPRPNIVLVMSDDQGWHDTGYNGHPYVQTPVLDEMAATGLRLDYFYSAAPLCSPTRVSALAGRHPYRSGTFSASWSIRPEEITIARILKDAGYVCGHFGKWHVGPVKADSPTSPGAMGFDEWLSHDTYFEFDPMLSRNGGPPQKYEGEGSKVVTDAAREFISAATAAGRPFLAVVWYASPHWPYSGLPEDLAHYSDLPDDLQDSYEWLPSPTEDEWTWIPKQEALQARYAEITAMDRGIGQLRDHLDAAGVRGDTLLWFNGDNGASRDGRYKSPLRAAKWELYEGGIRVPAVIEWPDRIDAARSSPVPAVTSDILPTICELAGRPLPQRPLDGISLVPLLDGDMAKRGAPICFWADDADRFRTAEPYLGLLEQRGTTPLHLSVLGRFTRQFHNFHQPADLDLAGPRAIRDEELKLVLEGRGPHAGPELFDVVADPGEWRNLAADRPADVERLAGALERWQLSVRDSLTGADYPTYSATS